MKRSVAASVLLLGFLLSACDQNATPTTATPPASSAQTSTAPPQTPASESAWEKYKREVREAGFVNPNKDDGSVSDDETRQSAEAICQGPDGAKGLWELYDISLEMRPQQVDMPRIKRAATDFCASVRKGR